MWYYFLYFPLFFFLIEKKKHLESAQSSIARAEAVRGSCDHTLTLPTGPQPEPRLATDLRAAGLAFPAPGAECEGSGSPKGPAAP